jgi:CubicO group peptidase (beta-lactamase class C family)
MRNSLRACLLAAAVAALFLSPPAFATGPDPLARKPGSPDRAELAAFFDGYLAEKMASCRIAGAAVAVVQGGATVFQKGYGMADLARGAPVDPESTMFAVGSLSKVFTWTAVMQQVERGGIDLGADVDRYLDFEIPAAFPAPITMDDLMAHASGLEDERYAQMSASPEGMPSLGEWVRARLPERVRAPGRAAAYANYGAALAGYIVERVSRSGFDDYLEREIFAPLGMGRTSFRQPAPSALAPGLARCYSLAGGSFKEETAFEAAALNPAPAGAARTSAGDMARFMIALLGGGRARILGPGTLELMRSRNFSNDPRTNGMAHGLWELDAGGERILGHAGSHPYSNAILLLFPRRELGVFLATNSAGGNAFIGNDYFPFLEDFVAFLAGRGGPGAPRAAAEVSATAVPAAEAAELAGSYGMTMGANESGPEKLFSLLVDTKVAFRGDTLALTLPPPYAPIRFHRSAALDYRQEEIGQRLVFSRGPEGLRASYDAAPMTLLVKKRWHELPTLQLSLLGACLLFFIATLVGAPAAFFLNRARGAPRPPAAARAARFLALAASIVGPAALLAALASLFNIPRLMQGRLPLWPIAFAGSILEAILALALAALAALALRRRYWGLFGRIHLVLAAAAAIGLCCFLGYWNLLACRL